MKDKISKVNSVIKKDGLFGFLRKGFKYLKSEMEHTFNISNKINFLKNKNDLIKYIDELFKNENYDRIIIWRSSFGWDVPLFQRPQHISNNLSKQKCLVFYEVTTMTDKVSTIEKIQDNLYLVNFKNKGFAKLLLNKMDDINKPKYLQFYSTDWALKVKTIKKYIKNSYKIIYEYIDDLSPVLAGTKELPKNVKEKYEYAIEDKENVIVVVTADLLKEDVISKRGESNLVFSSNGVDYDFFQTIDSDYKFEKEFKDIINNGKPTIGYYGALAKWFDYDLIKKISDTNKYNIVLFGIKYDDSYDNSNIKDCKNVYFLGSMDYKVLKNYANKIDVLIIPFLINDITRATSPVKIFEYMALKKPIVTTDMNECRKYESVLIGKNHKEFIDKINEALKIAKNKDYLNLLDREAKENDWSKKAESIIDMLIKVDK
ncbi:MAG: glycosyltransferase [Bacilli bacterium]|nr:glycosyltransferase [Bacilli bacterium]